MPAGDWELNDAAKAAVAAGAHVPEPALPRAVRSGDVTSSTTVGAPRLKRSPTRLITAFFAGIALLALVALRGAGPERPSWFPAWADRTPDCPGGWPVFASREALLADAGWAAYFTRVYGSVPNDTSVYPWCVGDLWMFYANELAAAGARVPPTVGDCPTSGGRNAGEHYKKHSYLSPANITWSWHPPPMRGDYAEPYPTLEDNAWVEGAIRRHGRSPHCKRHALLRPVGNTMFALSESVGCASLSSLPHPAAHRPHLFHPSQCCTSAASTMNTSARGSCR